MSTYYLLKFVETSHINNLNIQPPKVKFTVLQVFRLCGVDRAFRSPWTFGKTSLPYTYG